MSLEDKIIKKLNSSFFNSNKNLVGIGDDCAYLNKEDLLELIVEFTSIIAKADVSLDIIEDPFEINKNFNKRCDDIEDIVNKSHLKIVH